MDTRILQGEDKLAKIDMPVGFRNLIPNALFNVDSETHRSSRRLLTPVSEMGTISDSHASIAADMD